jgi:hypothetical protein
VLIVYKNWFFGVTPGRSSASFQHIKSFVQTNTKVIFTKNLLHVNVCQTCVTMVPLLCCSSKCVLLYPSGTPNPDTMYTILRYTIRLHGKNRLVEVQNRIWPGLIMSDIHHSYSQCEVQNTIVGCAFEYQEWDDLSLRGSPKVCEELHWASAWSSQSMKTAE